MHCSRAARGLKSSLICRVCFAPIPKAGGQVTRSPWMPAFSTRMRCGRSRALIRGEWRRDCKKGTPPHLHTTATIRRILAAGRRAGVSIAVKWDIPRDTVTVIPCMPMTGEAGDSAAISEAIANFEL